MLKLKQDARCMVNENGKMQCCFSFPMEFREVVSLADNGKAKCRRSYDIK
jgi:hypothetical protein